MTDSDVRAARKAVDSMEAELSKAEDRAAEVENPKLRSFNDEYLGNRRRLTRAGDRILRYYEAPGPGKPRQENRVLAELEAASKAARDADQDLRRRLLENATPRVRPRGHSGRWVTASTLLPSGSSTNAP